MHPLTWFKYVLYMYGLSLAVGNAADARPITSSFSLNEPVYANRGHGPEELLGNLAVCAEVLDGKAPTISFSVSMPDSGQVLMVKASVIKKKNDVTFFQFDDDGWGNSGKGTFQRRGKTAKLIIEKTGSQADANANIGRNYGTYLLSAGHCKWR